MIGLGNPGAEYAPTRHNAGQRAVELIAEREGIMLKRAMGKALWGHKRIGDKLLAIGLPGTFMNLSGETVAPLVRRYNIDDLSKLLIIHDEIDIEPGRIQIKVGGGLAGHNGLKSVKHHLKDDAFARVRIGVGRPPGQQPVADYLLRKPCPDDRELIEGAVERSVEVVEAILSQGLIPAMNIYN